MLKNIRRLLIPVVILISIFLVACGGGTESVTGDTGGRGALSIGLTDSAISGVKEVWVTISEIQVHRSEGDWETLEPEGITFPKTVDLLTLQNGVVESLGLTDLPAGHYTQIRLFLGDVIEGGLETPPEFPNCVLDGTGYHELTIPSGFSSGIKLNHQFDIEDGGTYSILLDFDAAKSIHQTGSGEYMMRPTIRIIVGGSTGSISGSTETGAMVMAQQIDEEDCAGLRIVQSTTADSEGAYTLSNLESGTYTVVVVLDGYQIASEADVQVEAGDELVDHNLALESGELFQTVAGTMADPPEQDDNPRVTAVTALTLLIIDYSLIGIDGSYTLNLPPGDYTLYFCADGFDTIEESITVDQDDLVLINQLLV